MINSDETSDFEVSEQTSDESAANESSKDETSDFEVSEQTSDESAANESSKEESRFCCDVSGCSKKFTKNRNLQNHIRLHQGERPFVCNEENCSKAYTNSSHLRRHKKIKHSSSKT
ncbi:Zinc finger, C2H2 type [Popillia japonica]|uniref:Zinc finger, C2H2 type n=1 Tax=Popillia japonica TaxID=7064 RepID=A0AAW1K1D8_POPJA